MKPFFRKIVVFLLPCIILAYPVDIIFSHLLRSSSVAQGEFEVWNDIYQSKTNVSIAIYGSSRAWVHIDPAILEYSLHKSAYNFGIDGQNIWLQQFRHNQVLRYNTKPKVILYSLDIFTLEPKSGNYNKQQHLPYMLWNKDYYKSDIFPTLFKRYAYFVPLVRYQNHGEQILHSLLLQTKHTSTIRRKGFAGTNLEWNSDFETVKAKQKEHIAKIDSASFQLMRTFLSECKKDNIHVIFVYTPEYIEGQNFVSNRKDIIKLYENLALEYKLPFLNYSDHEISYNRENFYNATHMNAKAANVFSRILAEDLKPLMKN